MVATKDEVFTQISLVKELTEAVELRRRIVCDTILDGITLEDEVGRLPAGYVNAQRAAASDHLYYSRRLRDEKARLQNLVNDNALSI